MKKNKLAPVILAVDDNLKNFQVIGSMLKGWGYRAVMAQSGSQCLDYLKDNIPDMILMDVLMPGLNGYDTSAAVKTSMKNRRHDVTIFESEFKFAKRLSQQFIVCCIDIYNLKQINDTHGHEPGDILIKKVVETIK